MLISALGMGIGSCWLCNIDREKIRSILSIPDNLTIDSVTALGYPKESPVIEPLIDSAKYWKDENGILHVPKRSLESLLHINKY
jgi:nitroreductase